MTGRYPDSELVRVGDAKVLALDGQISVAWGEETSLTALCVDTIYEPATHWYGILRDYQRNAGADAFGRLDGGDPWVRDASRPSWPVESNVLRIEAGADVYEFEDVWALLTGVDDSAVVVKEGFRTEPVGYGSDGYGSTRYGSEFLPAENAYEVELSLVPLAHLADYDTRDALLADVASPTIQL